MAEKTKLKAGCGVALVFAGGFLCGVIALFILMIKVGPLTEDWRDEDSKEFLMNHLAGQLQLSEEQIVEARPIVYEALELRYQHRKTYVEADIKLTRDALEKLKPLLDDKQKENAERKFEEWEKGKQRFLLEKATGEE